MAERNAAVHAARPLRAQFLLRERAVKLLPVQDAFVRREIGWQLALYSMNPVGLAIGGTFDVSFR